MTATSGPFCSAFFTASTFRNRNVGIEEPEIFSDRAALSEQETEQATSAPSPPLLYGKHASSGTPLSLRNVMALDGCQPMSHAPPPQENRCCEENAHGEDGVLRVMFICVSNVEIAANATQLPQLP